MTKLFEVSREWLAATGHANEIVNIFEVVTCEEFRVGDNIGAFVYVNVPWQNKPWCVNAARGSFVNVSTNEHSVALVCESTFPGTIVFLVEWATSHGKTIGRFSLDSAFKSRPAAETHIESLKAMDSLNGDASAYRYSINPVVVRE